jgi:oligopeptide/dipeptide ABC transporter ATP-binding protein
MVFSRPTKMAPADQLFERPRHPYTRALLSAIPMPDPSRRTAAASLEGELPDPLRPPPGCSFSTRCRWAQPACSAGLPVLEPVEENHEVRCRRVYEIA